MSAAEKWLYKWFCALFLTALFVAPNLIDGFKLKDITSPEGEEAPKKVQIRDLPPLKKIAKIVHVDDDGNEEIIEFKFEKVHKADYHKPRPVFKTIAEEDEKVEDADVEEATEKLAWSISSLAEMLKLQKPPEPEPESNGIIDWLKSFKSSSDSKEPAPTDQEATAGLDLLSYLNRWPFNLFIPFAKPNQKDQTLTGATEASGGPEKTVEPLSQEDFESLLHRLPNFVINPADAEDIECKKQLHIFHRQIRGYKLWTLQMMDASAKIATGVLRGNINQFGDFDLCAQIKTVVKVSSEQPVRIKGKYCLAHIELVLKNDALKVPLYLAQGRGLWNSHLDNPSYIIPRYTTAKWGVCVPSACPAPDVHHMLESTIKPYNNTGLSFKIQVLEDDCYVRKNLRVVTLIRNNSKIAMTVGLLVMLITLVFTATCFDYFYILKKCAVKYYKIILKPRKNSKTSDDDTTPESAIEEEEEKQDDETPPIEDGKRTILHEILRSFSLKQTLSTLLPADSEEFIPILSVLITFSTIMLYVSMKFLLIGHLPIANRDRLVKSLDTPLSIFIRSPLTYFDILLLVSGCLSTRKLTKEFQEKGKVSVIKSITARLLRYIPTLYLVLLFQTWILPNIGSGPLWGTLVGQNAQRCTQNMWRNFFAAQNVIDFEETCSPMTIQLGVEMQLFLLAPFFVWLYYSNEDVGFMVYGGIHAISVAARFSRTNRDSLSMTLFHGMNVSKFYRTANVSFASPLHRATAYLVGIGVGILLQSDWDRTKFPKVASICGWVSAIWCILWCFWYPSNNTSTEYVYNPVDAAAYASWAPLLLSLSIGWFILMTPSTEHLPFGFDKILLSKPLIFLSRISYPLLLATYTVVLFSTGQHKEVSTFHFSNLINLQEIVVIIFLGLVLSIIVDFPFRNIQKILLSGLESSTEETETDDQVETTKTDEGIAEKMEEEVEDIWGSEPEQEDETVKVKSVMNEYEKDRTTEYDWIKSEPVDESWRTESDIEQNETTETIETIENKNFNEERKNEDDGVEEEGGEEEEAEEEEAEEEEADEEDEEVEISEEEEVIRRPPSPQPIFRRRRWSADDD